MTVSVFVRSYTHSVTYVTDSILRSLKDILWLSGLDPGRLAQNWDVLQCGIGTWIHSGHLELIVLEVWNPATGALVGRWDVEIVYAYSDGDGAFWTDTDAIQYAIKKAGAYPGTCSYDIKVCTKVGAPEVGGWGPTTLRSTRGFVVQSIGSTVEANGLSGSFRYYRRT